MKAVFNTISGISEASCDSLRFVGALLLASVAGHGVSGNKIVTVQTAHPAKSKLRLRAILRDRIFTGPGEKSQNRLWE